MSKTNFNVSHFAVLAGVVVLGACAAPVDATPAEDTAATSSAIQGGFFASDFFSSRSAKLKNCSATQIAPRWVLTAAHCQPKVGDTVTFYGSSSLPDPSTNHTIQAVVMRAGVNPPDDLDDTNGDFADFALIEMTTPFTDANIAVMNWKFPAEGTSGVKVGSGQHNEQPNQSRRLEMVKDVTSDSSDDGGDFHTDNDSVDPGDSGGGFFVDGKLTGDLWGVSPQGFHVEDKYTSTPYWIDRILLHTGYSWSGGIVQADKVVSGTKLDSFLVKSELVCQYACDNTSSCKGYNFFALSCELLSSTTGTVSAPGFHSSKK